jgi:hypothetical protein
MDWRRKAPLVGEHSSRVEGVLRGMLEHLEKKM